MSTKQNFLNGLMLRVDWYGLDVIWDHKNKLIMPFCILVNRDRQEFILIMVNGKCIQANRFSTQLRMTMWQTIIVIIIRYNLTNIQ